MTSWLPNSSVSCLSIWAIFFGMCSSKKSHVNVHLTLDLGHPLVHTVIEGHGVSLHGLPHLINERLLLLLTPIRQQSDSLRCTQGPHFFDILHLLPFIGRKTTRATGPPYLHRLFCIALVTTKRDSLRPRQSPCPDHRLSPRDRYRINDGIRRCYFQQASHLISQDTENNKDDWMRGKTNHTKQTHTKKFSHTHNHTLLHSSVRLENIKIRANITDDKNKKNLNWYIKTDSMCEKFIAVCVLQAPWPNTNALVNLWQVPEKDMTEDL